MNFLRSIAFLPLRWWLDPCRFARVPAVLAAAGATAGRDRERFAIAHTIAIGRTHDDI
jgi:hypothetical protein